MDEAGVSQLSHRREMLGESWVTETQLAPPHVDTMGPHTEPENNGSRMAGQGKGPNQGEWSKQRSVRGAEGAECLEARATSQGTGGLRAAVWQEKAPGNAP